MRHIFVFLLIVYKPYKIDFHNFWGGLTGYPSTIHKPLIYHPSFNQYRFSSMVILASSSTVLATNCHRSGIVEFRVPANQTAPHPHRQISAHQPFSISTIAGVSIPARRREVAAVEPRYTSGNPDDCNAPFPPDLYWTRARYAYVNITRDKLKQQTTIKVHSSDELLYCLDNKRVRLAASRRAPTAFVRSQKGVF